MVQGPLIGERYAVPKPLINASSFLVGFIAGLAVVLGVFVFIAGAVNLSHGSGHATWAGALKLILGCYLLVAAVRKFRGRPRAGVVLIGRGIAGV